MRRTWLLAGLLVASAGWWWQTQLAPTAPLTVKLLKQHDGQGEVVWQVHYQLSEPAKQLVFIRNPDDSRSRRWQPLDSAFVISQTDAQEEVIRRLDGARFSAVAFKLTADYVALPKEYAPFSPFTDGGMAWFTGRFKLCPEHCQNSAALHYRFTQQALPEDHIRHASAAAQGQLQWLEAADDGQVVYVGPQQGQTGWLDAMIDPSLPYALRTSLQYDIPLQIEFFNQHLGNLPQRPMLLASFSATDDGRYGNQGGVLGRQLFVHWYGHSMFERMQADDFIQDTLWFFAHEVAHLYQANGFSNEDAWIHEGAAEFKAAYYLAKQGRSDAYLAARRALAVSECEAVPAGDFKRFYSCGWLLAEQMDEQLRSFGHDGLFSLWRWYTEQLQQNPDGAGKATYLVGYRTLTNASALELLERQVAAYFP